MMLISDNLLQNIQENIYKFPCHNCIGLCLNSRVSRCYQSRLWDHRKTDIPAGYKKVLSNPCHTDSPTPCSHPMESCTQHRLSLQSASRADRSLSRCSPRGTSVSGTLLRRKCRSTRIPRSRGRSSPCWSTPPRGGGHSVPPHRGMSKHSSYTYTQST